MVFQCRFHQGPGWPTCISWMQPMCMLTGIPKKDKKRCLSSSTLIDQHDIFSWLHSGNHFFIQNPGDGPGGASNAWLDQGILREGSGSVQHLRWKISKEQEGTETYLFYVVLLFFVSCLRWWNSWCLSKTEFLQTAKLPQLIIWLTRSLG